MSLSDRLLHHKNPFVRRGTRFAMVLPRMFRRIGANADSYSEAPPLMVNSVPKSGTHLLEQIAGGLPKHTNYGAFLCSTPPLTYKELDLKSTERLVNSIVPSELMRAHLFYEEQIESALEKVNCVQFFIYRDPRDVALSEAHYLLKMNRWHRLHSYMKKLGTVEKCVSAAILGLPDAKEIDHPDIGVRFGRYQGWIDSTIAYAVRYEDLMSDKREDKVREMVEFWANFQPDTGLDINELTENALGAINSEKSHTFRAGGSQKWKREFTDQHKEEFKSVAGKLLIDLGYETSLDW